MSARPYGPAPAEMPIPVRLNLLLVAAVVVGALGLLALSARVHGAARLLCGIAFSYLMLTGYALLHEAAHDNLHPDPRLNHGLGVLVGLFFPVPFSVLRTTHQGHHLRNRTDFEMFDLYYPTDSAWLRRLQWYGTLCGLFWPLVPLGTLLVAACPTLLQLPLFARLRSTSYLLGDIQAREIRAVRSEGALILLLFAALGWLTRADPGALLVPYACFAFNWSTRQYIGHAFTRRHVIEGAWNLRHNPLMSAVLLHGEYDLNHHRRPDVSWLYLPRLGRPEDPRPSYLRQYLRMWGGPRLTREPAPERLGELQLSVHA